MKPMTTRALRKLLRQRGCFLVGTEGSHEKWEAPDGRACTIKAGTKQQAPGTLRNIQDAMAPELGQGWIDREQR
jgi:predicted RNA binding protein YcfA (HicA-like mRNA interferase family)